MAQKTTVQLMDDIDGGPADETVEFSLDGVTYSIDLSSDNAELLRATLDDFITRARRVGTAGTPGRRGGATRKPAHPPRSHRDRRNYADQVRRWANANGYNVSERGRISSTVHAAYAQAHPANP